MDRRLSVLHVQHSLEPGGMENGVVNVARALPASEFAVHVCCMESSGEFAKRLPEPGNVTELHKGSGFSPKAVWRLIRLIRKLRPDVIHSHNLGALIYAALATFGGRTCPILHGEHGQPDEGGGSERRLRQRRRLYRSAAKVHTVSFGLRDYFVGQGFDVGQVIALVNGVDTDRFSPGGGAEARRELGIAEDARVVLIVGRLIESKGHRLLFEAFQEVVGRFRDALLLVVGDGGDAADEIRRAAAESPVSDRIRMEGFQPDPAVYYRAADVLVAPSTIEGLSNVVLEAMACGLPSLLHDACGNREVIVDGVDGLIADLSRAEGIASQLGALFDAPGRMEELGENARRSVVARFSLERMAAAYADTYRELAGRA